MRPFSITFLALLLASASGLLGCRSQSPSPRDGAVQLKVVVAGEPSAQSPTGALLRIDEEMLRDLRITTTKAERRPAGEAVNVLGELRIDESRYAQVGAPISARVVRLLIAQGDTVRSGQVLTELQSGELGKARADLAVALTRVELTGRVLARKRDLAAERIAPEREVQEAESQAAVAEAELKSARASLQALGAGDDEPSSDASRFALRAPIGGVVVTRSVSLGQVVDPTKALFEIADLSRLWLVVHAFERDAVRVKPGSHARVTLPAMPGRAFTGTVSLVGRQVDPDSRTVAVRLELPNPDQTLRPGMSASAAIVLTETGGEVVTVPVAALQRLQDRWVLFIPKDDGAFEVRGVGRGRDLVGEVEILTGLRPNETVVVEGAFLLKAEADKARGEGKHEGHESR